MSTSPRTPQTSHTHAQTQQSLDLLLPQRFSKYFFGPEYISSCASYFINLSRAHRFRFHVQCNNKIWNFVILITAILFGGEMRT